MNKKMNGYLELILGPMFSGKTSKILDLYKQCEFSNIPVVVINHTSDKRYSETKLSLSCKTTFSSKTCVIGLVTVFSVFLALFFSTTTFSNDIFIFKNKVINLNSFIKYLNRY